MATSRDWRIQESKRGGKELYLPGEFVSCWDDLYGNETEWKSRQPDPDTVDPSDQLFRPPYRYIPDELKRQTFDFRSKAYGFNRRRLNQYAKHVAYKRPSIEISEMTHFTDPPHFDTIKNERVIKAFPKRLTTDSNQIQSTQNPKQPTQIVCSFVWFTGTVGNYGAKIIHDSIGRRHRQICHFLHYDLNREAQYSFMANKSNCATSMPFTLNNQPWGNRAFKFDSDRLIGNYCRSVFPGKISGYECRCMGTFVYNAEVMFAVLIHPSLDEVDKDDKLFLQQFPLLDQEDKGPETVVYQQGGRFYWKPFSTSGSFAGIYKQVTGIYKQVFCRWDQVAFAFYFPKNREPDVAGPSGEEASFPKLGPNPTDARRKCIGFQLAQMEGDYWIR